MFLTAIPYTDFVCFKSHQNFKKKPFFGKGAQTFAYNCIYIYIYIYIYAVCPKKIYSLFDCPLLMYFVLM